MAVTILLMIQLELLLTLILRSNSNCYYLFHKVMLLLETLKCHFFPSAHHTMESSFHFYDMMATECSLQKQVPPRILYLKYNKQLSTFQVLGTFVGASKPEEPIAQITKTFIRSFLFQNYISTGTLKMSFFSPESTKAEIQLPEHKNWILLSHELNFPPFRYSKPFHKGKATFFHYFSQGR